VLALVLFGAKRLPQVGKAAGEAIREFKSAFSGANNGGANNSGGVIAGSGSAGGQTIAPAADEARLDDASAAPNTIPPAPANV
jgi:TatA/E family protein of Tat protein translocase